MRDDRGNGNVNGDGTWLMTTVIEVVGLSMLVLALVLVVGGAWGAPAGLLSGTLALWTASWLLQGAPIPGRTPPPRGTRR